MPPQGDAIESSGTEKSRLLTRTASPTRRRLNPTKLAYLIGPAAFLVILLLMHIGYTARESAWVWLGLFAAIFALNLVADRFYDADPSSVTLNLRVISQVTAVTAVIYLTGWGPVLWGAYAFIALENVARGGSRVWRTTALWSLAGMAVGQFGLTRGWLPSELTRAQSTTMTVMGAFMLLFVIRMAGAIMEQKERLMEQKAEAEATLRMSEDRFRSLIQNSSDVTMILDEVGDFRYVSPAIKDLLQYDPDELVGHRATDYVHPVDLELVQRTLGADFQAGPGTATLEFRMVRRDGTTRDVEAVVCNQTDRPSVAGYVSNIRDITERKKFEALLAHRALHDPLTGLANRQLILDRAEQMLVRARRTGAPVAALFIDLDNFKDSNDSLGHGAGDQLLQMVAGRLIGILRASDTVGRLGGDEFVILADGVSLSRGPEAIAERVHQVLEAALPPPGDRRHGHLHLGEHRHRVGRSRIGGGTAARRRHCPVPGQGGRTGPIGALRTGHAVSGEGAARSQVRSGISTRTKRVLPALSPHLRSRPGTGPGGRGPASVAAPDEGDDHARRLHPGAGGEWSHRRSRPVGAQRGLSTSWCLAHAGISDEHLGQRLDAAPGVRRTGQRRPRRAACRQSRSQHADPRGHGIGLDERCRSDHCATQSLEAAGCLDCHRRFRHGVLLPRLSAPVPR